jgi:GntR family transcriptional regulator
MATVPKLVINTNSAVPAYRQIVDNLRSLLVEGALKPGATLPTVRDLGLELGVHFNTIAEAYRLLASEGWLDLKRRRGAVVTERAAPAPPPEALVNFRRSLRQLIAQARAEGVSVRSIAHELDRFNKELSS